MSTFSFLLESLDQSIGREDLEEASMEVRSVARADCARLLREMAGILVSGLERAEAVAFQHGLAMRDFPVVLVADEDLPTLHEAFTCQRFEVRGEALVFSDYLGHERIRPLSTLVFAACGRISKTETKADRELLVNYDSNPRGGAPRVRFESNRREENVEEFRLDFFFCSAPHRLHLSMNAGTAIFHRGNPVRMRDSGAIGDMLREIRGLLPPGRVNSGLAAAEAVPLFPSVHCYENEIRWHFHRLESGGWGLPR